MNDFSDYLQRHPLPRQSPHQPLTEAQCDELFGLLDDDILPGATMSAEMADGYLTACVVGPVPVPAQEWMEAIFGQPTLPVCADQERQHRLLQLLLHRHGDSKRIAPYQLDTDGIRQGDWVCIDWAEGFRLVMLDYPQWESLANDRKNFDLLGPIALFAQGCNPDKPELQIDEISHLLALLSLSIYNIRSFWKLHKHATAPALRETGKVGRNDPCPNGSGKKYKKCCGA